MLRCCLLQEHELNLHVGLSQSQLHTPGTHYRLTLDLVSLYTPLNTSKHTCLDSLNLKPPSPLYPLQDFKALYKCCITIIIIIIIIIIIFIFIIISRYVSETVQEEHIVTVK